MPLIPHQKNAEPVASENPSLLTGPVIYSNKKIINHIHEKQLDVLFQRIYEDNVSGKLSDERFATMSASYEAEQKMLKELLAQLKLDIKMQDDKTANVSAFVKKVKRYTEIKELTPSIVNELFQRRKNGIATRLYRNLIQRCLRTLHFLI